MLLVQLTTLVKGGADIYKISRSPLCCTNYKIRVNSVHPGFIRTPMVENAMETMPSTG